MRARKLLVVAALLGVISMGLGCSSEQTTSTTTQSAGYAPTNSESQPAPQSTTTTTTTSNEPDSVLGATFHLVGTIILLPFRMIGLVV
jgi:hypothetical protein